MLRFRHFLLIGLLLQLACRASALSNIDLPVTSLLPHQLAVVYLHGDKLSEQIARYYIDARQIPQENLVGIEMDVDGVNVDPGKFAVARRVVDAKLPRQIEAYALTWATPYKVGCMSMTAAFALGYNTQYCASGCELSMPVPYFHSTSLKPYRDFGVRPSMMIAASDFESAKALIDRGITADETLPSGTALLLSTSDKNRTVREVYFPEIVRKFADQFDVRHLQQDAVENVGDILFYFTGLKQVDHLDTLTFMPGAMADHLTSSGGRLVDSRQMSAIRWLEAGATGSYGTAIEPCNFLQKFPNPLLAMWHYTRGSTLIEAYWRSVQMPGQGNFIGEPLARPFAGYRLERLNGKVQVHSPQLSQGAYRLWGSAFGIERDLGVQKISANKRFVELERPFADHYRIERLRF